MTTRTMAWAVALCLMGASAPAFADGAGPDDCSGKVNGASCYNYDVHMSGTCVADMFGMFSCESSGSGTGGTHTGTTTTTTNTGTTATQTTTNTNGGGAGGADEGGSESSSSGGCAATKGRSRGGAEAMGLGLLLATCAMFQRRRR